MYESLGVDYMTSKRDGATGMTFSEYCDLVEFLKYEYVRTFLRK